MLLKRLAYVGLATALYSTGYCSGSRCSRSPWQEVYDENDGGVVEIFSYSEEKVVGKTGTGFVFQLGEHVLILTNQHVASRFSAIRMRDGEIKPAVLVDASELHDLALLKTEGINLKRYGILPRGRSSDLRIGDEVMTIGHPVRESHHISVGFFTGKQTDERGRSLLRVSMAVDPGNSGGPLLNEDGEVVGIVTLKVTESSNIAFAIPIEKVDELVGDS